MLAAMNIGSRIGNVITHVSARGCVATCVLALLLCSLPGCKVDEAKEVKIYRDVLDAPQSATQPATQPAQYQANAPLSLHRALELANQFNEQLPIQGEQYLQTLIAKDRAFASFLPTISVNPTTSYVDRNSASHGHNPNTNTAANLSLNLFNGFRDLAAQKQSDADILRQQWLLLDLQATVLLEVSQTYYQVLRSQKSVEVLENTLLVQDARVKDARARQKAGVARPLDTAQAEAQAAGTRADLVNAKRDVRVARQTLAFLVGAPVNDAPLTDEYLLNWPLPAQDALISEAQQHRRDLKAALEQIASSRKGVEVAFGQYYPSVTLNFDYYLQRQSVPGPADWQALLQTNIPIFTAGKIHADVRSAWSDLRVAKLQESQTRRQVIEDVQIAYEKLTANEQEIIERGTQVVAAKEALRLAEESYVAGLSTNLDRLTAQDALLQAQLALVNAQFDQKIFYLNLLRAVGNMGTSPGSLQLALPNPPAPPDITPPFP